jgi:hypothetical protein
MALLRGRGHAVPQDVYDVAYDVLNARLALSYRALAEGFTIDDVLVELLTTVPAPGDTVRYASPATSVQPPPPAPAPAPITAGPTSATGVGMPPIVLPGDPPAAR